MQRKWLRQQTSTPFPLKLRPVCALLSTKKSWTVNWPAGNIRKPYEFETCPPFKKGSNPTILKQVQENLPKCLFHCGRNKTIDLKKYVLFWIEDNLVPVIYNILFYDISHSLEAFKHPQVYNKPEDIFHQQYFFNLLLKSKPNKNYIINRLHSTSLNPIHLQVSTIPGPPKIPTTKSLPQAPPNSPTNPGRGRDLLRFIPGRWSLVIGIIRKFRAQSIQGPSAQPGQPRGETEWIRPQEGRKPTQTRKFLKRIWTWTNHWFCRRYLKVCGSTVDGWNFLLSVSTPP